MQATVYKKPKTENIIARSTAFGAHAHERPALSIRFNERATEARLRTQAAKNASIRKIFNESLKAKLL